MDFLVASMRHDLLPLYHRLRREGATVQAIVWRPRYEQAWDGSIAKIARHSNGDVMAETLAEPMRAAQRGELAVLTDVYRIAQHFHAAPHLLHRIDTPYPAPVDRVRFGGWFDGESIRAPHLLVADQGAWTGGLGPAVLGGITLVRLEEQTGFLAADWMADAVRDTTDYLKRAGFKGLFHFDAEEDLATSRMRLRGLAAGWPALHTQAFVAELESLSGTIEGKRPTITRRYITAVPISIPPWPNEKRSQPEAPLWIEGLTPQQQGEVMWHDIAVDAEARKLRAARLDGLLGVAIGASDSTPALARMRAMRLCQKLVVPELQYRADAGALVESALATLEDRWHFSI